MAPVYTDIAAFEAYVEGWETEDPDALNRLLERAERDVDNVLGPIPVRDDSGLKLDPELLLEWEAAALSRAVCAQAEWRFRRTDATLNGAAPGAIKRIKGPDFETEYAVDSSASAAAQGTGLYSPRVALELKPIAHLRRLIARMGPRRSCL